MLVADSLLNSLHSEEKTTEYKASLLWGKGNLVQFSGSFEKLKKATISYIMSVCPSVLPFAHPSAWNNSAAIERISLNLIYDYF